MEPGLGHGYSAPRIAIGLAVARPATALHEYIHHLQRRMPGFHEPWAAFYRARTTLPDGGREPIRKLAVAGREIWGRRDRLVHPYMARRYEEDGIGGEEVLPTLADILFFDAYGPAWLARVAAEDPELLDLAAGFWLRFDPEAGE